jgi:hypothetical protein
MFQRVYQDKESLTPAWTQPRALRDAARSAQRASPGMRRVTPRCPSRFPLEGSSPRLSKTEAGKATPVSTIHMFADVRECVKG